MNRLLGARWAGASAIIFAVVFVAVFMYLVGQVFSDMTAKEFSDTYDDSGTRVLIVAVAMLGVYATALLGLFLHHFLGRLRTAEGGEAPLSRLAGTAAMVVITTWIVATMAQANVAGAVQFGGFDVPSMETAAFFSQLGTAIVLIGTLAGAAALMALTAAIAFRTGVLPTWLAWLSVVTAVVSLFGAAFFPAIAFPVWLVAVGVWQIRATD